MQELVDVIADAAMITKLHDGILVMVAVNRPLERLLHRAAETMIGRPCRQVIPSVFAPVRERTERTLIDTGWLHNHALLRDGRGDPLFVESLARRHESGDCFVSVLWPTGTRFRPQIPGSSCVIGATDANSRRAHSGVGSLMMPTDHTTTTTGQRLREAREAAGLSKRKLAYLADVSEQQIILWERDDHHISVANLTKLIPHLGGSFDYYYLQTDEWLPAP